MNNLPLIGFGTYRLSPTDCIYALSNAFELGYRNVDTAPLYGNEKEVGETIYKSGINRKDIWVTTKVSWSDLQSGNVIESIERSLEVMKLDYIDLILLHAPVNSVDNWRKLVNYYETNGKNKVRYIGVSNFDEIDIKSLLDNDLKCPTFNQIELNPFITQPELTNFCKSHDIKIIAHTPLAKGEKFNSENLIKLSENNNTTPAKLMLKWGINNGYTVIPRSCNNRHIDENLFSDFYLDNDTMEELSKLNETYATHKNYLRKNRDEFGNVITRRKK